MVTEIRIYFEGDEALRPGFRTFLGRIADAARSRKCRFDLIATNGTPVQDYQDARRSHPAACNILLLDSENAITEPLPELCAIRGLTGLSDQVFWMAQIMESWFLADPQSLKKYYGDGFRESALRCDPNVERVAKADVLSKLKTATKAARKHEYHKTGHAPDLLARIDPELVKSAAPQCDRLFAELLAKLTG